jgi:hypothetical protein
LAHCHLPARAKTLVGKKPKGLPAKAGTPGKEVKYGQEEVYQITETFVKKETNTSLKKKIILSCYNLT